MQSTKSEKPPFHLVFKNDNLVDNISQEEDIEVSLKLPNGVLEKYCVKFSSQIGLVKQLYCRHHNVSADKVRLKYDDQVLLEPLSFSDYPNFKPPSVVLDISFME